MKPDALVLLARAKAGLSTIKWQDQNMRAWQSLSFHFFRQAARANIRKLDLCDLVDDYYCEFL
jgi:hypothetical protein